MTIYHSQSTDAYAKEPPKGGSLPAPEIQSIPCGRRACESRLDVTHVAPEKREAFADIHGWIDYDAKRFCSKRCKELAKLIKGEGGPEAARGAKIEALRIPTRGTVRKAIDANGNVVQWLVCDLDTCKTNHEVVGDAEAAARVAAANGFVEVSFGVYCSAGCVTQARIAIASGQQVSPTGVAPSIPEPGEKPKPVVDIDAARMPVAVTRIADESYQDRLAASREPQPNEPAHVTENRKARRERERLAAELAKG